MAHLSLPKAVRAAYQDLDLTQETVVQRYADLVEERGEPYREANGDAIVITQTKLSKWSTGADRPSNEALGAIEAAIGRPNGWILHAAGYVQDVVPTVEAAALMDPALTRDQRRILLTLYQSLVKQGAGASQNEP